MRKRNKHKDGIKEENKKLYMNSNIKKHMNTFYCIFMYIFKKFSCSYIFTWSEKIAIFCFSCFSFFVFSLSLPLQLFYSFQHTCSYIFSLYNIISRLKIMSVGEKNVLKNRFIILSLLRIFRKTTPTILNIKGFRQSVNQTCHMDSKIKMKFR